MTTAPPDDPSLRGGDLSARLFREIRRILLEKLGFDLGCYKDGCIKRRIALRMRALGFLEPESYLEILLRDDEEAEALMKALTIHVSQFFRNPAVFSCLEKTVLPRIIRRALADDRKSIRLWSVGCAAGEEPYSLALLLDALPTEDLHIDILGTDVSTAALEQAREGLFPQQRLREVPGRTLKSHFSREGDVYRLHRTIRDRVRFLRQDILSAGSYPAVDLILCRNVLIYFSRPEQEKVLRRFAAALSPAGHLVLGQAETLTGPSRTLYSVECPKERIYRCSPAHRRGSD